MRGVTNSNSSLSPIVDTTVCDASQKVKAPQADLSSSDDVFEAQSSRAASNSMVPYRPHPLNRVLVDYGALRQDLGVLDGILGILKGVKPYDARTSSKTVEIGKKDETTQGWVAIAAYFSIHGFFVDLLNQIEATLPCIQTNEVKEKMSQVLAFSRAGLKERGGSHAKEYWYDGFDEVLAKLNGARSQIASIRNSFSPTAKASEFEKLTKAAIESDPHFFSNEEKAEFDRLEPQCQSHRQELQALQMQVAAAQSQKLKLAKECELLEQTAAKKKQELPQIFEDALKEVQAQHVALLSDKDEVTLEGIQLLHPDLKPTFKNDFEHLFQAQVKSLVHGERAKGTYLKFGLKVEKCESGKFMKGEKAKISLSLTLSHEKAKLFAADFLQGSKKELLDQTTSFLRRQIPRVVEEAVKNAQTHLQLLDSATTIAREHYYMPPLAYVTQMHAFGATNGASVFTSPYISLGSSSPSAPPLEEK